jgi:hypothetical protein
MRVATPNNITSDSNSFVPESAGCCLDRIEKAAKSCARSETFFCQAPRSLQLMAAGGRGQIIRRVSQWLVRMLLASFV